MKDGFYWYRESGQPWHAVVEVRNGDILHPGSEAVIPLGSYLVGEFGPRLSPPFEKPETFEIDGLVYECTPYQDAGHRQVFRRVQDGKYGVLVDPEKNFFNTHTVQYGLYSVTPVEDVVPEAQHEAIRAEERRLRDMSPRSPESTEWWGGNSPGEQV